MVPFSSLVEVNPRRRLRPGVPACYVDMASVREQVRGIIGTAEREFSGGGSRFQKGDTLFARITPCAENRKIAFVDFLADGAVGFGSTEFIVLGPRPMLADPRFVYYLASWDPIVELAVSRMTGTSGRQRVPEYVFREELHVLAPPLAEQRKIAEILSSMDEAIENTEAVIEQVRRVKQGLAQELLTHGLPGRHTDFKQTEVGEIPACWEVVRVGNVADINPENLSQTTPPDLELRYIDISAVTEPGVIGGTNVFAFKDAPSRARRLVREGDVLVSTVRPYLRAFARVRSAQPNLVCSTGFAVLRTREGMDGEFIYQWVLTGRFANFLHARTVGSNYPAASASDVADFPIPRPCVEEQTAISSVLAAMDARVEAERGAAERLRAAKSALMHVLLTGQVRVRVEDSPGSTEA